MIQVLNLIRTRTDGSDQVDIQNFVGTTTREAYKKACEYLHNYEEDLMEELEMKLPLQSIDFIKDEKDAENLYLRCLWSIIDEVASMGSCHYEVDTFRLSATIKDNEIKEIDFTK